MADQAHRGKLALQQSNYGDAIKEFTAALKVSPKSPDYLIQRATAYQRAKKYAEALDDANHAVVNAQERAKREFIVEAQFRRGCALYSLERYGDAEFVLGIVKRMKSDHKMADMWINKTAFAIKSLPLDDERGRCTVTETPDLVAPHEMPSDTEPAASTTDDGTGSKGPSAIPKPNLVPAAAPALVPIQQTPAEKIRYDWYQNSQNIYFTIMAKGVPRDKAQVDINEHSLSVSFPLATGASYDLTLDPLFATVKPAECVIKILPSKVEIMLVKTMQGQKWSALESSEPVTESTAAALGAEKGKDDAVERAILTDSKPTGPAYPTSSKSGPKDWDKISRDLRNSDGDGKESSVNDEDYEGGDAANSFFKKLFKDSSPEVQRAMMKSYTESNGTALSTNWDEVSKSKVETLPPDGMEAKEW